MVRLSGAQCDPDVRPCVDVNLSDCCGRGRVAGTADVHAVGTDRVYRTRMATEDEVRRCLGHARWDRASEPAASDEGGPDEGADEVGDAHRQ